MAIPAQDFTMYQDTTRTIRVTVTGTAPNSATAIKWCLAKDRLSEPVLTKTLAGGGVANTTATTLDVLLVPADTASLAPGDYYHELRIIDSGGNQDVVMEGTLSLKPTITE